MNWRTLPWDPDSWTGDGHEEWKYHIYKTTSTPRAYVGYVAKPRKEGVRRHSTKSICHADTLLEAKGQCEKFERDRLAAEARTATNTDIEPQKPGIPW